MNYAKFLAHARRVDLDWARFIAASFGITCANIDLWANLARKDLKGEPRHG